jgi:hypothetical protein
MSVELICSSQLVSQVVSSDLTSVAAVCSTAWTITNQPTIQDLFTVPLSSDLNQVFMCGFGLPVLCYLVSWAYQICIDMFNDKNH